jgi:hypothetical protein
MGLFASGRWLEECGLNLRVATVVLGFCGPLWLIFSFQLLIVDGVGVWRPLTVTAPPFAFAVTAVLCAHQSKRRDAARVSLLIATYLELAVFALILGIGVNSINGQGWGA